MFLLRHNISDAFCLIFSIINIQDEGLNDRNVDLSSQEPWDRVREACASVASSSRLVHLRHPSKKVKTLISFSVNLKIRQFSFNKKFRTNDPLLIDSSISF